MPRSRKLVHVKFSKPWFKNLALKIILRSEHVHQHSAPQQLTRNQVKALALEIILRK